MAEFCLECWNRINETDTEEKMYIISRDLELAQGTVLCVMLKLNGEQTRGRGTRT